MIRRILASALVAIALAPLPVRAQTPSGGISVSPSLVEPDEPVVGSFSSDITYVNHESEPRTLTLRLLELRHDLDGAVTGAPPSGASAAFRLDAARVTLPANGRARVRLSGSIPAGVPSVYLDVVASMETAAGSAVAVRSEWHSQFLLRGRRPWDERIAVTDVGSIGDDVVYAVVRNIGTVHVAPRGTIEIRDGDQVLARVTIGADAGGGGRVLPSCPDGCSRRYRARWTAPAGVEGPLTLTATMREPAATLTKRVPFGTPSAEPSAEIRFVTVTPERVELRLTNTGSVPLPQPAVQIEAMEDGRFGRAHQVFPQRDLAPNEARSIEWTPSLPDGRYELGASVLLGTATIASAKTQLVVGSPPPAENDDRPSGALLGLAGALVVAAMGTVIALAKPALTRIAKR